mmetsp:Transcript_38111/g.36464  ORF Transcript_38111/g.36464 Transcript_38111/m.36464 type:complete len:106 (+) Transcript_38111:352-669(+)
MSKFQIILLASQMKRVKMTSNTIICKQDEPSKHNFFVKSGRVRVVRDVSFLSLHKYLTQEKMYNVDPVEHFHSVCKKKNVNNNLIALLSQKKAKKIILRNPHAMS